MTPERWKQIDELAQAAIERASDERAGFLDEACGGDDELRGEVEAQIAYQQQASKFLEEPAFKHAAELMAETQTETESMEGRTISHYSVLRKLGAGGMGEVYLAQDTTLNRKVAIKFLSQNSCAGEEARKRLVREARAAAALDHPNICAVHEVGEEAGYSFIVMQYVEGATLANRIQRQPFELREALDIAVQIAEALAEAHSHRIIHRDVKPQNVMLTPSGQVKVLDFGLARVVREGSLIDSTGETESLLTVPGLIIGTVPYMSPEQVRGQEADHRSDIFSFGAILYEMMTGRRAFQSDTMAETMTAILRQEPEGLTAVNNNVPPQLARIVQRCLEKPPERRFQSSSDLGFAIKELTDPLGSRLVKEEESYALEGKRAVSLERLGWIVALGLLLTATLWLANRYFTRAPTLLPSARFSIALPESMKKSIFPLISPNGRRIAFVVAGSDGKVRIWIRQIDSLEIKPLPGTDDTETAFWSPDSRFLAFQTGGKLMKTDLSGGPPQTIRKSNAVTGAWNRSGVIVLGSLDAGLARISADGGQLTPLTTLDRDRREEAHLWPVFLPDDQHFLYTILSTIPENSGLYVGSLDGQESKRLSAADTNVAYQPFSREGGGDGHLIFAREGRLHTQRFDAASANLLGDPFPLSIPISVLGGHYAPFSVSDDGVLVCLSGGPQKNQLVWFDRSGKQLGLVGPAEHMLADPALSRDERQVAAARLNLEEGYYVWRFDLTRDNATSRFTVPPRVGMAPVWSPDGSRIIFASGRESELDLYQKRVNGGAEEALLESKAVKIPLDWSPDSQSLIYAVLDEKRRGDLWVLPLAGERKPKPFIETTSSELQAAFSPDGRWVAYASDESGAWEVYVRSFPSGEGKVQVSLEGGADPRWRRDGKELFYLSSGFKLMSVPVNSGSGIGAGVPQPLFQTGVTNLVDRPSHYAVASLGQRFLINTEIEENTSAPITVVLNWRAELKRD